MANLYSEEPIVEIVAIQGRDGTELPIDDEMSSTSENPVQNKVVKQAIDNAVTTAEEYASGAVEAAYQQLDEEKQDTLEDSGAHQNIKTINGESILGTGDLEVGSQIDVDDALSPTSLNPVENRVIYAEIGGINENVTAALNNLNRLANRVYGLSHEAITTEELEKDYDLIINGGYQRLYQPPQNWATNYTDYFIKVTTPYPAYQPNTSNTWDWTAEYYRYLTPHSSLANVSAVGILAILKHGEYIAVPTQPDDWAANYDKYLYYTLDGYVFNMSSTWNDNKDYFKYTGDSVTTQGNTLFIDCDESDGYTFRGINTQNGIEIVKIWFFESDSGLTLTIDNYYSVIGFSVKKMETDPTINNLSSIFTFRGSFTNAAMTSTAYNSFLKYLEYKRTETESGRLSGYIPQGIENFKSNHTEIYTAGSGTLSPFYISGGITRTGLKKVSMPELISITADSASGRSGFNGCTALVIKKEDIPKLQTIANMNNHYGAFGGVPIIELPETVVSVGTYSFSGAGTSSTYNNVANAIIRLYCKNAAFGSNWCTIPVTTDFEMCDGWATSIDISVVASGVWTTNTPYLDLINNKLADVGFVEANNDGNADFDEQTQTYVKNTSGTGSYNTAKYITMPSARFVNMPQTAIDTAFNKGWDIRGA